MIEVEYTLDSVEQEEGPNLYLKGKPEDYLNLFNRLHVLGVENGVIIQSDELKDIFIDSNYVIRFVSREKTNTILKKMDNDFFMVLDHDFWHGILGIIISISYGRSHNYIDDKVFEARYPPDIDPNFFLKKVFIQDTGMVISSEW